MPYMDGYEFVAALKADAATRDIPVAFLSTTEDMGEASRLGAVAHLKKPLFADKLLQVVELFARLAFELLNEGKQRAGVVRLGDEMVETGVVGFGFSGGAPKCRDGDEYRTSGTMLAS